MLCTLFDISSPNGSLGAGIYVCMKNAPLTKAQQLVGLGRVIPTNVQDPSGMTRRGYVPVSSSFADPITLLPRLRWSSIRRSSDRSSPLRYCPGPQSPPASRASSRARSSLARRLPRPLSAVSVKSQFEERRSGSGMRMMAGSCEPCLCIYRRG